jgi:hypothetical protein
MLILIGKITCPARRTGTEMHKRIVWFPKFKQFISHSALTQHTLSGAKTAQDSHALPAVRFTCLLRGRGTSFQDGVVSGEGFLFVPF